MGVFLRWEIGEKAHFKSNFRVGWTRRRAGCACKFWMLAGCCSRHGPTQIVNCCVNGSCFFFACCCDSPSLKDRAAFVDKWHALAAM